MGRSLDGVTVLTLEHAMAAAFLARGSWLIWARA